MHLQIRHLCVLFIFMMAVPLWAQGTELIYAEMEFPLSFVPQLHQYQFNPLGRFQTEVEGRIQKLTCDPLVDIYQISMGQQGYRSCLANFRTINLRTREVLNFNLIEANWADGNPISFEDVWFSLEYRKLNDESWKGNQSLVVSSKGNLTFDAYLGDQTQSPKAGEFYFPIVNKKAFDKAASPSEATVNKSSQSQIGFGRYAISDVQENRYIRMKRNDHHPYYKNLTFPQGARKIDTIRMQAFPKARINRNEQFIEGRVHLLTSVTQADVGYIVNSYPDAKIMRYSDDSFSSFMFNCRHPYLKPASVRRAFNYFFRKKLTLRKALGDEGELISAPLPSRNFFYNIAVPPYEDNVEKGLAVLRIYRYFGLDLYESGKKVFLGSDPSKSEEELKQGDQILKIEEKNIGSLEDFLSVFESSKETVFRVTIARGNRVLVKRIKTHSSPNVGILNSVSVLGGKVAGFPELTLIANNPEGKDPMIKEICGALKEDLEKIGILVKIDYLDSKTYYPRLQNGEFDIAYRTVKLTGTPNLYRMFYKDVKKEGLDNANYGDYNNERINEIAWSTRNITEVSILKTAWSKAHEILHQDPPYLFLWSRRHILMHDPRVTTVAPGPEYEVPYGYTEINGLINIFNEVHLWAFVDKK